MVARGVFGHRRTGGVQGEVPVTGMAAEKRGKTVSEKRKKIASICLKSEATGNTKIELFDSTQWEDAPENRVRARLNGRWVDDHEGGNLYLDTNGVAAMVGKLLSEGKLPPAPPRPTYAKGQRVLLPVGEGVEQGYVMHGEPFLGADNRWHVMVHGGQSSFCLMPCDMLRDAPQNRKAPARTRAIR